MAGAVTEPVAGAILCPCLACPPGQCLPKELDNLEIGA